MMPLDRDIARSYLPQRRHYWYVRGKLASDPLYAATADALLGVRAPLLDLGCGIGLLAHALRARGYSAGYLGIDNDAAKIETARAAAGRRDLRDVRFELVDLANGTCPPHCGSVALLDVLQYLPGPAAAALIGQAAARTEHGARLVIRSGLEDGGARTRFTRAVDMLGRRIGWMNAAPERYPTRAGLEILLEQCGLRSRFCRLSGPLPFNNWLIVAERVR